MIKNKDISGKTASHRIVWIDAAKFFAMLAVLLDHSYSDLYNDVRIRCGSYFGVGLFILLMGLTTYGSIDKSRFSLRKKLLGILIPYLTASFICCVIRDRQFDFEPFVFHLIHFSADGPFYYIMLYCQLLAVTPVVYHLLNSGDGKRFSFLPELAVFIIICVFSSWTTCHTNILNIWGGGGKLLGGSYLILFTLGMWFGKYYERISLKRIPALMLLIVSLPLTVLFGFYNAKEYYFLDKHNFFEFNINPPGITLMVYSILVMIVFYSLGSLLASMPESLISRLFYKISIIGRHTLYIFLYHHLIMQTLLSAVRLPLYSLLKNFNLVRLFYFVVLLTLPIGIEYSLKAVRKWIALCYKNAAVGSE